MFWGVPALPAYGAPDS